MESMLGPLMFGKFPFWTSAARIMTGRARVHAVGRPLLGMLLADHRHLLGATRPWNGPESVHSI